MTLECFFPPFHGLLFVSCLLPAGMNSRFSSYFALLPGESRICLPTWLSFPYQEAYLGKTKGFPTEFRLSSSNGLIIVIVHCYGFMLEHTKILLSQMKQLSETPVVPTWHTIPLLSLWLLLRSQNGSFSFLCVTVNFKTALHCSCHF